MQDNYGYGYIIGTIKSFEEKIKVIYELFSKYLNNVMHNAIQKLHNNTLL